VTDYTYSKVAVYAELGGALRLARNSRAFATDPVTAAPVNVTQGAFTAPYFDTDSSGIADFTATTPGPIRLTTGATFVDVYSEQLPGDLLAAAASAAASAASAALSASLVGAPADTAVAAIVGNPASATRVSLSSTYVPQQVDGKVTASGKADGSLTVMDTGQAIKNFGNNPITVASGVFAHTVSVVQNAGYMEVATGTAQPLRYMRASVAWPVGSTGAVAFVVPSAEWDTGVLPNAGIHFVVYGNGQWHISRWNAGESIYGDDTAYGRFADVRDGAYRDLTIYPNPVDGTVLIVFPDASTLTLSSPYITSECSKWGVFELYETLGTETPATIRDFSIDSFAPDHDSAFLPRAALAPVLASAKSKLYRFTTSGSGAIPPGALGAYVTLIGGGAGGGAGRRGAAGSVRCGGGGGGAAGVANAVWFPASSLGSGFNVVIGTGGAGGVATAVDNTDGANGADGLLSSFSGGAGAYLRTLAGGNGKGGTTATGIGGGAGAPLGTGGAAASTTGGVGANGGTVYTGAPGGAASGGGITAADVPGAGGVGGAAGIFTSLTTGGTGGVVGGAVPGTGTAAVDTRPGDGPGGGAASITGAGQAGANAAGYGAGGAGGGASLNGNASGNGGNGGPGYAEVTVLML